jgi:hypothetical protein
VIDAARRERDAASVDGGSPPVDRTPATRAAASGDQADPASVPDARVAPQ